jgi:transposase
MTHSEHKVSGKGKRIRLAEGEKVFVGADVHRKTYSVAVWSASRGLIQHWTQPSEPALLARRLASIQDHVQRIVYEAGPTGYALVRTLRAAGFAADVIVTSQMLRTTAAGAKSDRLDCRTLAEHACKDLLKPVHVPSEQEEHDRQIVRLRERLARKLRLVRQQIKSFLLVHGVAQPAGLNCWSDKGIEGLRALTLPDQLRFCLDVLIDEEQHALKQVERLTLEVKKLADADRFRERVRCLRSVPGVGLLTAMTFATELIAPERFDDAGEVARTIGLAPMVRQSGDRRREGALMKDGNKRLRTILVEATWRWSSLDERGRQVYRRLLKNTGDSKKAIGGAARKLAIILWRLVTRLEAYRAIAPTA